MYLIALFGILTIGIGFKTTVAYFVGAGVILFVSFLIVGIWIKFINWIDEVRITW